jgi:hypothetical protein
MADRTVRRRGPLAAVLVAGALAAVLAGPAAPGHPASPAAPGHPTSPGQPVTSPVQLVKQSAPMPPSCGNGGKQCLQKLVLPARLSLSAYANVPLTGSAAVTHALVVVHGAGRDPVATFTGMMQAAGKAGAASDTLVLAPFFKAQQDKPGPDEAMWTDDGWKQGDGAVRPKGVSSFEVMDQILGALATKARFPNLTHITLVGHSAGGQFTQRYAALGLGPNLLRGVQIDYVVANPSSYLYFDQERPADGGKAFGNPSSACADYDRYKYGLEGRTGYTARLTPAQVVANYTSRRITYLQGGDDATQNGDMDTDCGANVQGPNRLLRGQYYFARMHALYPYAPHTRIVVPGIAHDHYDLFESPQAMPLLFGRSTAQ